MPKLAAVSKPASSYYRKGSRSRVVEVTEQEFMAAEAYEGQRFFDLRTHLPHTREWLPNHHCIGFAVLPSGKTYLIDGNSRRVNVKAGILVNPDSTYEARIHSCETMDDVRKAYDCYDNKNGHKNSAAGIQSTFGIVGFRPKTDWIEQTKKLSSACNIAYDGLRVGAKKLSLPIRIVGGSKVDQFIDAIRMLDEISPDMNKFTAGYIAAAILILRVDGRAGLEFLDLYNTDQGCFSSDGSQGDAVRWAISYLADRRLKGEMASSWANAHARALIGCYNAWKRDSKKFYVRRPNESTLADFASSL